MEWVFGIIGVSLVIGLPWYLLHGATSNRLQDAREKADQERIEAEISEGVIDVRRKAEDAKHDDPDSIKRVFDKYNS